jgi:TM2 domain-containing membrane protein YozV
MNRFLQAMAVISALMCTLSGLANFANRNVGKGIVLFLFAAACIGVLFLLRSVPVAQ